MKIEKSEINGVKTTKITFEDGTVWEQVDLPKEFYPPQPKLRKPKAKAMLLKTSNEYNVQ